MSNNTEHHVQESADKITLTTKVKRGSATRDQDTVKVKAKADNPVEAAYKLRQTLDALEQYGVADTLRETQPGESE